MSHASHRHGQHTGKIIQANGDTHYGSFKNKRLEGQGTIEYADGRRYEGSCKDGKRHGEGKLLWVTGNRFDGQFDSNLPSKGTYVKYSGETYEYVLSNGKVVSVNGMPPGAPESGAALSLSDSRVLVPVMAITAGILFYFFLAQGGDIGLDALKGQPKHVLYADGPRNAADFHPDETVVFSNGDTYSGNWKEGKIHGQGTYRWNNHDEYSGRWKMGKMHGQGYYSWADGKKYHGKWRDNKRNGHGTCAYPNGNKYTGEWKDDKRHGQGTYTWANIGNKYTGGWKDDKRHGRGKLVDVNGEKFVGEWENDQMKDATGKAAKLRYNAV